MLSRLITLNEERHRTLD